MPSGLPALLSLSITVFDRFVFFDNLLSEGNGFSNFIFAKRISIVRIPRLYSKWAKILHFIWSERPHAFSGSESCALREPL
jgi:hypothetical protein